mgnify:CR=1 FL=1
MPKYVAFEFVSKRVADQFVESINNHPDTLCTIIDLPESKWIYNNSYTLFRLADVVQQYDLATLVKAVQHDECKAGFEENNLYIGCVVDSIDNLYQGNYTYQIKWQLK